MIPRIRALTIVVATALCFGSASAQQDLGVCVDTGVLEIVASPGSGQTLTDICTGELYVDTDPGDGDGRLDSCCCGNQVVDPIEECDDGNVADGDGCSAFCLIEPEPVPMTSAALALIAAGLVAALAFSTTRRERRSTRKI